MADSRTSSQLQPLAAAVEKTKTAAPDTSSKAQKSPEEERAEALERQRAGRIEIGVGTVRKKTDVRLDTLKNLTRTRSYDKKTPELINNLSPAESPEQQGEKLDALLDVSVSMLTTVIYYGHNVGVNLDDFSALTNLSQTIEKINPRPAENAAFHKLKELANYLATHPSEETQESSAAYVRIRWANIIGLARQMSRDAEVAAALDLNKKLKEEEKWTFKGFLHWSFKEHPYASGGLALLGAVGGFFAIRGICRRLFGTQEQIQPETKQQVPQQEKTEKPKGPWGWLKWALGGGLAIFLVGKIFGVEKTIEWLKKQAVDAKDAWDKVTGEGPEFVKNRELYTRMADRISSEMGSSVQKEFLANLNTTKYKDVIEEDGVFRKYLLDPALDKVTDNEFVNYIPGIYTKDQRRQAKVIRTYLKGSERERLISELQKRHEFEITDDTTLGQVIVKLDEALSKKEPPKIDGQKPPEKISEKKMENQVLPYLKDNYAEVEIAEYRKIAAAPYRDFMAARESRSFIRSAAIKARSAGAEMGLTPEPAEEEQRLIRAEMIIRRFLQDNAVVIGTLPLPAGATVGVVIETLVNSGEMKLRSEMAAARADITIHDADIEGTTKRDSEATKLPEDQRRIYLTQRKMLAKLLREHNYVKNGDAEMLIKVARSVAQHILDDAITITEKKVRDEQRKKADELEKIIKQLQFVLEQRNERWKSYTRVVQENTSPEMFHQTFLAVIEANQEVMKSYGILETKLATEQKWRSIAIASGLQLSRIAYVYLTAPEQYRSLIRYYYGVFGLPTAAFGHFAKILRRPRSGSSFLRTRITEGESRLHGVLGGADETGAGSLEQRASIEKEYAGLDEQEKQARNRFESEKGLLQHDRKMLIVEEEIETLRLDQTSLKKRNLPTDVDDLRRIEQKLAEKTAELKRLRFERIRLEKSAIAEAADDLYGRLEKAAQQRALNRQEWKELEDLARRGAEYNRDLMRTGEGILHNIQDAVKRGAPAEEIEALRRTFNDVVGDISFTQKTAIQRLSEFVEKRLGRGGKIAGKVMRAPGVVLDVMRHRKAIKTAAEATELASHDKKQFRKVFSIIINWQRKGVKQKMSVEKPLLRVIFGKLLFYSLTLGALPAAIGVFTRDEKTSWQQAAGQAAADIAPVTGTISDFYTAIRGREMISGKQVVGTERALRVAFGFVGLASDILLIAGIGAGMRAGLGALRTGAQLTKLARLKGAVKVATEQTAKTLGKQTGTRAVTREVAEEGVEEATKKAAREVVEQGEKARGSLGRLLDALRAVEKKKTVAILSLAGLGIAISLVKSDEMETPLGMHEVLGGEDGVMEEIDLEQLPEDEVTSKEAGEEILDEAA